MRTESVGGSLRHGIRSSDTQPRARFPTTVTACAPSPWRAANRSHSSTSRRVVRSWPRWAGQWSHIDLIQRTFTRTRGGARAGLLVIGRAASTANPW